MVALASTAQDIELIDSTTLLKEAREATKQKAWETAEQLWKRVILVNPGLEEAWLSAASAIREQKQLRKLEEFLIEASERGPKSIRILSSRAWNLINLGDRAGAEKLWIKCCELFPEQLPGYIGLGFILKADGRIDELEVFLERARKLFPGHVDIELLYASTFAMRRLWIDASREYQKIWTASSDRRSAISLADSLRHIGKFDDADSVLSDAIKKFPDSIDVFIAFASNATFKKDWLEAICRWDDIISRFPENSSGYLGMGRALKGARFFSLHENLFFSALTRFPDNEAIAAEQARLAVAQMDWPTACIKWEQLARRFPLSAEILSECGFVLLSGGRPKEAENIIRGALDLFPNHLGLGMNFARAASAQSNWLDAVNRWASLYELHPHDAIISQELGKARYNLGLLEDQPKQLSIATRANSDDKINESNDPTKQKIELVLNFESLGENCEFGLFQREVGAEPLGLLRFAGTSPSNLITVLNCNFEGVGTTEYTELVVRGEEYVARDKRFGMTMHTHINPANVEFEPTYQMIMRKLQYLKRKLIEDLEDAEKIFVYKDRFGEMLPRLADFRAALNRYGQSKLLVVELERSGMPNGHIEFLDDKTMVGYIDRHGDGFDGRWNIPVSSWLSLCNSAMIHGT